MYEKGEDLPKGVQSATAWYRKAAEQGNGEAQFKLATFYFNTSDYSQARHWCVECLRVAQMILGDNSSPGILQKYSKALDEYRRDVVRKLEEMRAEQAPSRHAPSVSIN